MIYPNSNLPAVSQAWGRSIQKNIDTVQAALATSETNNKARDAQLQASYTRLDKTVVELGITTQAAQDAADDAAAAALTAQNAANAAQGAANTANSAVASITSLGTAGSSTTVNASNIIGGTITGIAFRTATSGQRVELSGTSMSLYNSGGSLSGSIYGSTNSGYPSVAITSDSGSVVAWGGAAPGARISDGTAAFMTNLGTSYASGNEFRSTASNNLFTQGATFQNGINVTAGTTSTLAISATSVTSSGTISTGSGLQRTQYIGGGTTGASVNDTGTFIRTSSSARYKQDISDTEFNYEATLALQPKLFRLKDEAAEDENAIFYPGFIAEEIAGTALDVFVSYQPMPDGTKRPDGVRYAELTAALVSAIKHQDSLIRSLSDRIDLLESK